MSLNYYEQQFRQLNINRSQGRGSPHKMCMLLSVIELIRTGDISANRIYFDDVLKSTFSKYFNRYRTEQDRDNPHLPFFHLRSEPFWHHQVKHGQDANYEALSSASGSGVIEQTIAFAYLDETLFELLKNQFARDYLTATLESTLEEQDLRKILEQPKGWDWLECEVTVQSYFAMLEKELRGERYNKAEYRRALLPKLHDRSEGAIEFKHQNISAILLELGFPYIAGYKPAFNYQQQLKDVVEIYLVEKYQPLVEETESFIDSTGEATPVTNWAAIIEEAPEKRPPREKKARAFKPRQFNYAERESHNRRLGESGEAFVLDYEKHRLAQAGREDLVKEIEWTSKTQGDGAGYDIRSFLPEHDEELFIEVKTTNSGKYQPFLISDNEVAFAEQYAEHYALYRVFQYRTAPKLYILKGQLSKYVHLDPKEYRATFE